MTGPCGQPGCDCGYTIEKLQAENARLEHSHRDLLASCESLLKVLAKGNDNVWANRAHYLLSDMLDKTRAALAGKETK